MKCQGRKMHQSGKLSNSREGVSTATAKGRPTEVVVLDYLRQEFL